MSKLKYYDPVDGEWKPVYSEAGSNSIVTGEIPSGDIDSSNDEFTTSQAYLPGTLEVFVNGLRQVVNVHYTETSPLSGVFTFDEPPLTGDNITVNYMMSITTTGNADTLDGYHLSGILEAIYPVGATFISSSDTMPALVASIGTWERLEGVVIAGRSETPGNPFNVAVNTVIGEDTHTLTRSELPNWVISLTARNSASNGLNSALPRANTSTGTSNNLPIAVNPATPNSQPHNNIQRTKIKYMWERVA